MLQPDLFANQPASDAAAADARVGIPPSRGGLVRSCVPRGMARRGGRDTERDAAARVVPHLTRLHELVLQAFRDRGAMNDRELERLPAFTDLAPSTARKRRSELFQAGRLIADGKRDGLTVWRVAPQSSQTGESK